MREGTNTSSVSMELSIFTRQSTSNELNQVSFDLFLFLKIRFTSTRLIFVKNFFTGSLGQWVECLPMVRETGVKSHVVSYQRLKKMVLDTSLLYTQHYKVRFKGKVEQSRKRSCALPYTSV